MSEHKRIFMLVSYLVDDNDDMVSECVPMCGTKSEKVARQVVQSFLNNRNQTCTLVWGKEIEHRLPGMIEKEYPLLDELLGKEKPKSEEEQNLEKLLTMVDMG